MTWNLQASAGAVGESILWRGEWNSALSYNPYDAVHRGVGSYLSLTNNANIDPATDSGTNWQLMVEGVPGSSAFTFTTADFVLPAIGASVPVMVEDASWITIGQMLVVQTAGGSPTDAYSLKAIAKSGNQVTLENVGSRL